MTAWTAVRVVKEIDDVVYDSEAASVIHHWDEGVFSPSRMVMATNPEGRYFLTYLSEGTILRPDPTIRVYAFSRKASIALLAETDAPDRVLEGLGVELITPVCDDQRHGDVQAVAASGMMFGKQVLFKTSCGHFWMLRSRGIFGKRRHRHWQVSQREAITWGLRNGAAFDPEPLALLGVRDCEE